ncbi:MAG: hypothetical protein ACREVG_18985, partial [Burkholderiales bacterium]
MKQLLCVVSVAVAAGFPPGAAAQADLTEMSAAEAARLIRAGKLKSEDLVRALLDTAAKKKDLNAFITL